MVETWKNHMPVFPFEFWDAIMYAKPDEEVTGKVKDEKKYRVTARVVLKTKKYRGREGVNWRYCILCFLDNKAFPTI